MSDHRCVLCGADPAPGGVAVTGKYAGNVLVNARLCYERDAGGTTCYEQITQGMIKSFTPRSL